MKQIEYAKVMSNEEKKSLIHFFKSKDEKQNSKCEKLMIDNKDLLINAYMDYNMKVISERDMRLREVNKKINLWNKKECVCGKPMRFVDGYGFWGCTDYMNKEKEHSNFNSSTADNLSNQFDYCLKVRVNKDWATEIIRDNNFRDKIKAKQLILFYDSIGLEDLRSKYGYKSTIESISSYVNANEESKKEERKVTDFMANIFGIINSQLALKYKIQGEKEKTCIIDLITSDDEDVFLIEIKRNTTNVDDEQLSLYNDIIKCVMNTTGDTRELTPLFIISNLDGYDDPNEYFFFENFDDITDKSELKRIMKMFKHN